jgi:hypothetical protein
MVVATSERVKYLDGDEASHWLDTDGADGNLSLAVCSTRSNGLLTGRDM